MLDPQGCLLVPHLHYEVIKNGKKINSQRLKLPTGKILNNEARNRI